MWKQRLTKLISSKYFLTALFFVVWSAFFDQNDWITMRQRQRELHNVKANVAYLDGEIKKMDQERNDLINNPIMLEKYAREKYHMRHEGEDVYVIEKK